MKQRIVFVNLHANWMLVKNAAVYLFKNSAAVKHKYLLDYLLAHNEKFEVCNFINDRGFSIFTRGGSVIQKLLHPFAILENYIILKKNGINPRDVILIHNASDIKKDDILIAYNLMETNYRGLDAVDCFKVVSMIHYGGNSNQYNLIHQAGIDAFLCEVNLSKTSELFNRYCKLSLPWIVHPFVYAERFKCITSFEERKTKCFSTGTITYKYEPEFIEVYGDPCDQPARKFTKDNPEFFKDTVDSTSQDYLEDDKLKKINADDSVVSKCYKRYYNRTHTGKQKKYFSFDMVEKFNTYKMHLVGEEILGVPGIGYVEGMACGSAYIGLDSPMYSDLGLIPGVHYITYDGTMEGLRTTIEYWQRPENQQELELIAKRGCEYVRSNFSGTRVAEYVLETLMDTRKRFK